MYCPGRAKRKEFSLYGRKVPVIVIPATGVAGCGDTGLRCDTADF
jgi:hypothetical protein